MPVRIEMYEVLRGLFGGLSGTEFTSCICEHCVEARARRVRASCNVASEVAGVVIYVPRDLLNAVSYMVRNESSVRIRQQG
jgi:hypothetical protein